MQVFYSKEKKPSVTQSYCVEEAGKATFYSFKRRQNYHFCLLTGLIPEHISLKSLKFYNPTSNEDLLENYFCSKKSKYVQKCPMLNMCLVDDAKNYPRKKIWAGGSLTFVVPLLQKAILFRAYPSSSTIHANVLKAVMTNFLGSFFSEGESLPCYYSLHTPQGYRIQ